MPLTYSQAVISDGPVSYWELSEVSGSIVKDSVDSNNGTYNNCVLNQSNSTPGVGVSASVLLDGSSSFIEVPSSLSLHPTAPAISLEAIINTTVLNSNYHTIIEAGFTSSSPPYADYSLSIDNTNKINFGITIGSTNYTITYTTIPTINTWYYLVATYDNTSIKLYVNGTQVSSTPASGSLNNSNQPFSIGRYHRGSSTGQYFPGYLCGIAFYNKALTPTQITTHYTGISIPIPSFTPIHTSQLTKEVIFLPQSKLYVSQLTKEVIFAAQSNLYVSQLVKETIFPTPTAPSAPPASTAASTQIIIETLSTN
jgi:hypothetical protein